MAKHRTALSKVKSQRQRASQRLKLAIERGEVTRPDFCEECLSHSSRVGEIQGAHYNYSPGNSTIVRWLCVSCHRIWDIQVPKPVELRDEDYPVM